MKHTASIISSIFYPMLIPVYSFFLATYLLPPLHHPFRHHTIFFALITSLYTLLPVLLILLLKYFHAIRNISLITRKERMKTLLGTAILYTINTYLLYLFFPLHPLLIAALFATALLVFLLSFCNLLLKISIHAATMGAWLGYWLFLFQTFPQYRFLTPLIVCTVLTGTVLSARLYLKAHSPQEVYSGTACGFAVFYITLTIAS